MINDEKYYIKKPKGYNPCILGNADHRDPVLDVLPNCTGFATARFNEYGNYGECKYLGNTNAENYVNYVKSQGLSIGQTPRKGACMVWEGKGKLAGHVAIVEDVISNNKIVTSESGWSQKISFWRQVRTNDNGRWGLGSDYTFKGFIYNPAVPIEKIELPSRGYFTKGDKGQDVELINQWLYEIYHDKLVLGDLYGNNTVKYVKLFQEEAKRNGIYTGKYATIDGNIGKLTLEAMRKSGFPY